MDEPIRSSRWPLAVALLLILLVAAWLRLYRLPELPLGLHYDEAANGILAGEIARGASSPIFIPSYTGKEVLFFYWTALWMKLLGLTPLALRLSAALAGLATVVATVWAVRELLHERRRATWIALLTGAFLATSFWHLVLSRYGFRAVTQPLLQAMTVATLWRGLRCSPPGKKKTVVKGRIFSLLTSCGDRGCGGSTPYLMLAGLLCGLTAYTYLAARAFPVPLAAALLTLLIDDRDHRRTRLRQMAIFVAAAALALAPLAHYWLTHPGSFLNRTQQVAATSWTEVWGGVRACLGMFFLRGDPYIRFNIPHRPLFDPITAALSLLGIGTLLKSRGKKPTPQTSSGQPPNSNPQRSASSLLLASRVFLLTYLPTMLLPSALATGEITPSNLRTAGLLPFVYLLPALGLDLVRDKVLAPNAETARRRAFAISHLLFVILTLILLTPITATAYFRAWAPSADLYYAADGDLSDVAAYLNQTDLSNATPYVASTHYRHPTLAFLAQDYAMIRWLTGGRTVVFPAQGDALLIFPRSASEDLDWVRSVLPEGSRHAAPPGPDGAPSEWRLYKGNGAPAFYAYRVGPAPDLAPTHPLTADLGHAALLMGYDVVDHPHSGQRIELAVWWQVKGVPNWGDYGPVARLTDPWGLIWGETLAFHYPAEQWTPGEWVVDHLSIPVNPGAPPGEYAVRFSFYSASGDSLLPVLDDEGRYAGTAVELPVHLARATEPPTPDDLGIRTHLDARTDGLTLLGANLDTTSARPGERLYLTLFWRAEDAPPPDIDVTLTLGGTTLYADAPVHGTYPTSEWSAGEVIADRYDPRLPLETPPGDHSLRLRLQNVDGTDVAAVDRASDGLAFDLGTVVVQETKRIFTPPSISHPFTATLGHHVQLLGYDLSPPGPAFHGGERTESIAPGDTITLTLYWRALTEMDESYTVFTHLLAPDGSMAGQRDAVPVDGTYPTDLWLTDEVVADTYEIPIRADAPPGEHRLEVGMYVAETGARLPVAGTSEDAIVLQTIVVAAPSEWRLYKDDSAP